MRNIHVRANFPAQLNPVHLRHRYVRNKQVYVVFVETLECGSTVFYAEDAIFRRKLRNDVFSQFGAILRDSNAKPLRIGLHISDSRIFGRRNVTAPWQLQHKLRELSAVIQFQCPSLHLGKRARRRRGRTRPLPVRSYRAWRVPPPGAVPSVGRRHWALFAESHCTPRERKAGSCQVRSVAQ